MIDFVLKSYSMCITHCVLEIYVGSQCLYFTWNTVIKNVLKCGHNFKYIKHIEISLHFVLNNQESINGLSLLWYGQQSEIILCIGIDSIHARSSTAYPRSGTAYPRSGTAYPRSGTAYPRSSTAYPRSGTAYSRSSTAYPRSSTAYSRSGTLYICLPNRKKELNVLKPIRLNKVELCLLLLFLNNIQPKCRPWEWRRWCCGISRAARSTGTRPRPVSLTRFAKSSDGIIIITERAVLQPLGKMKRLVGKSRQKQRQIQPYPTWGSKRTEVKSVFDETRRNSTVLRWTSAWTCRAGPWTARNWMVVKRISFNLLTK